MALGAGDFTFGLGAPSASLPYVAGSQVAPAPAPAPVAPVAPPVGGPVTAPSLAFGPSPVGAAPALYAPQATPVAPGAAAVPAAGGGILGGLGIMGPSGLNWENLGMIGQGIGGLAGIWNAFQQNKLAKETLAMNKEAFNENLDNSIQTYNTNLRSSTQAEYSQEGRSRQAANRYAKNNSLVRGN